MPIHKQHTPNPSQEGKTKTPFLIKAFQEKFKQVPELVIQAPCRINIIGEHTDYNNGFVLPAAIDKYIYFAVKKRSDNSVQIYDANKDDWLRFSVFG